MSLFLTVKLTQSSPFFYLNPSIYSAQGARVNLIPANNTGKDPVTGELFLEQTLTGVYIVGRVEGLEPGNHGFHVHAVGDLGNDCKNAGGHFNPQMVNKCILCISYCRVSRFLLGFAKRVCCKRFFYL